jgi:hypothetical protein
MNARDVPHYVGLLTLLPRPYVPVSFCAGAGLGCAMKTRTHFAFRIDVWDDAGDSIYEHVVGSEDYEVAVAAFFAACQRWPKAKITLRQGARVVKKNW